MGCHPLVVPPCTALLKSPALANMQEERMFQLDTKPFSLPSQLPYQLSSCNFPITVRCLTRYRLTTGYAVSPSHAKKIQTGSWSKRWDSAFLFRRGCRSVPGINPQVVQAILFLCLVQQPVILRSFLRNWESFLVTQRTILSTPK